MKELLERAGGNAERMVTLRDASVRPATLISRTRGTALERMTWTRCSSVRVFNAACSTADNSTSAPDEKIMPEATQMVAAAAISPAMTYDCLMMRLPQR